MTLGSNIKEIDRLAFDEAKIKVVNVSSIETWCNIKFNYYNISGYSFYSNPLYYGADLYIDGKLVSDVVIPNTVDKISNYAFINYNNLRSVTISHGVKTIGDAAFSNCPNLENIYIADSVTTIGNSAFSSCISLKSVVIPDSVTSMVYAFSECHNLMSVTLPDSVVSYYGAFSGCYRLVEVNIPVGSADYGEVALRAIEVHSGESKIIQNGDYVFYINDSVNYMINYIGAETHIELPLDYNDEEYVIYDYAFAICNTLEKVIIPNTIKSLPHYAFYYCKYIDSIYIPSSVTSISDTTFYGTDSFHIVLYCEISKEVSTFKDYVENYYVVWDCNNNDIASDGYIHVVIDGVYYGLKGDTAVVLSSKSNEVYFNIRDKIIFKSENYTVTGIETNAFYVDSGIEIVIIPCTIKYIESRAFRVFNGRYFSIYYMGTQNEWNNIYVDIFNDGLNKHYYSEYAPKENGNFWHYVNGVPTIWPEYTQPVYFNGLYYTLLTDGTYCVTDIDYSLGLTSIVIPDTHNGVAVTSIGTLAFADYEGLKQIEIGANVTSIGYAAFSDCVNLVSVTLPESLTTIDELAFNNCPKLSIIKYFGTKAQWNAISIDSNWLGVDNIAVFTIIYNYGSVKYYSYTETLAMPTSGSGTCSVTDIAGTTSKNIIIPCVCDNGDIVTAIGFYAFESSQIKTIVIPHTVTKIGERAFEGCNQLTDVYFTGTEDEWNNIVIEKGNDELKNATIHFNYVPEE